jgi:hypothetical protein
MAHTVMTEGVTTNGTNQHEWLRNRRIGTFVKFVKFVDRRARRNVTEGQTFSHISRLVEEFLAARPVRLLLRVPGESAPFWRTMSCGDKNSSKRTWTEGNRLF